MTAIAARLDPCVNWFKLMVEETNLEASAKLSNPEISEREAILSRIDGLAHGRRTDLLLRWCKLGGYVS